MIIKPTIILYSKHSKQFAILPQTTYVNKPYYSPNIKSKHTTPLPQTTPTFPYLRQLLILLTQHSHRRPVHPLHHLLLSCPIQVHGAQLPRQRLALLPTERKHNDGALAALNEHFDESEDVGGGVAAGLGKGGDAALAPGMAARGLVALGGGLGVEEGGDGALEVVLPGGGVLMY